MKIHTYLLCYNEGKIIRNILNYYSQFSSKIFVLDNYSTDNSVEIASSFECVEIIQWKTEDGKINEARYCDLKSELYKKYSRKGGEFCKEEADCVISCDMDEILYHPDLVSTLKFYKENFVTVPCVTGFDIVGDNELDGYKDIISQYKMAERNTAFDKRIVFDPTFNMSYSFGCHPRGPGFEHMKKTYGYRSSNEIPLALLHYKKIGRRELESAHKNSKKLNLDNIQKTDKGEYIGLGSHYLNIIENDAKSSNLSGKEKELFLENGYIDFRSFKPATGDKGDYINPAKGLQLTEHEFETILDSYSKKAYSLDLDLTLQRLISALRPNHPILKT